MFSTLLSPIKKFRVPNRDREFYEQVRKIFGVAPKDLNLYKTALIHKSASVSLSKEKRVNNERLEYLGDAILDAIVANYLFAQFPNQKEGFLTKMRSKIVSRTSLNQLAMDLGIDKLVVSHTNNPLAHKHIHGDALEALVGALYLDKGFKVTSASIVDNILRKHIDLQMLQQTESDFKSRLIEWAQKNRQHIQFICNEQGIDSSNIPGFCASVTVEDTVIGEGSGTSKKEAEQNASMVALTKIDEFLAQASFATEIPTKEPCLAQN